MEYSIDHRPAYSLLKVFLNSGEEVTAEAGALVFMKGDVDIQTHTGGIGKALLRGLLGSESVFLNKYTARSEAELWFAPSVPGDIQALNASEGPWVIQDTSYLGHCGNVDVSVAWRGLKGLLTEGELVWIKAVGEGKVWINAYGGIERVSLGENESAVVDNMHFVAMQEGMEYNVRRFGGWKSFLLGGEGFVVEVHGPGDVFIQTRTVPSFVHVIEKYLPTKKD